jgi:hypothetical protein
MLKDASVAGTPAPASLNGTIPVLVQPPEPREDTGEGWIERRKRSHDATKGDASPRRSFDSGRSSLHDLTDAGSVASARTPDSITPPNSRSESNVGAASAAQGSGSSGSVTRHRSPSVAPRLSPSPARAVTGKDHLTVSARGSSSLVSNITNAASPVSPLSASLARVPSNPDIPDVKASRATVSSLLDQLTEIHDRQQAERKTQWDSFLKKRQKALAAGKSKKGETFEKGGMVGLNQMGRSAKNEEWKAFGRLVRGGIPLAYRADIWAGEVFLLDSDI